MSFKRRDGLARELLCGRLVARVVGGLPAAGLAHRHIDIAAGISQQTGLLSNDALIVAVMQANGLTNLASNDGDFDRVSGLTRYGPG